MSQIFTEKIKSVFIRVICERKTQFCGFKLKLKQTVNEKRKIKDCFAKDATHRYRLIVSFFCFINKIINYCPEDSFGDY